MANENVKRALWEHEERPSALSPAERAEFVGLWERSMLGQLSPTERTRYTALKARMGARPYRAPRAPAPRPPRRTFLAGARFEGPRPLARTK